MLLISSTHIKIICGAAEGQIWDGAFLTSCPAWCAANPAEKADDFLRISIVISLSNYLRLVVLKPEFREQILSYKQFG